MALSLKDPETDRLAREVARLTGESLTEAVRKALAERLERERLRRGKPRKRIAEKQKKKAAKTDCRETERNSAALRGAFRLRHAFARRDHRLRREWDVVMVIDTSAVIACLFSEPECDAFAEAIDADPVRLISVVGFVEASMVLLGRK